MPTQLNTTTNKQITPSAYGIAGNSTASGANLKGVKGFHTVDKSDDSEAQGTGEPCQDEPTRHSEFHNLRYH